MRLTKIVGLVGMLATLGWGEFDPTRFNFGADWDFLSKNLSGSVATSIDYATIWLNDPSFNQYWHGDLLKFCKSKGVTPVFYAYIVAKTSGLGDADVGGRLDAEGGKWLKSNLSKVKSVYENYAQQTASSYGTNDPVIWLMEPDYFQYCNGNDGVSYGEAAGYMHEMIATVKKHLPNALFSLDISPWNNDQASYIKAFDMTKFTFMHTSGGRTEAGGDRIRYDNNNNVTWSGVNSASGKCIIADDGYAQGGAATGHAADWDDLNSLKNRIGNGVVAITQKSPKTDWGSTITSNKSSLSSAKTKCAGFSFKKSYTLTVAAPSNGKVTKSPDATTYDSGATVTLTSTPNSGFKLSGWSGDATGAAATVTLTMTKDMAVKANFVDVNAKTQFSVTINVTGSGIVKLDPDQAMFDSGSTVKLEAFGANGGVFSGWGGALSGTTNPHSIVVTGNKTVTASFSGSNISIVNLVKNGTFADGDAGWTFSAQEAGKATGAVAEGEFAVTLQTKGTEAWHIQLMQPGISLTKDKKYVFSFFGKAQSETGITVNVGMGVDPYTSYSKERKPVLTATKTKFEYSFTMTSASTTEARVEFNGGIATASWSIDDVKLEEAVEIGIIGKPAEKFTGKTSLQPAGDQVTITWFDHAGRQLQSVKGDYRLINQSAIPRFTGSAIAVVKADGRTFIHKTVTLDR